ncbi:hypothetical protein L1987_19906 [Smallanthus sonchifolius]|uniref:Uncharacterized protein n=1 Tax=Smallanthus sonchifolius TaxID=185202 RepID=A0ACB9IPV8_9ASTR|nr:hypothetical protein L1987_19906 [Smallanthus sonchifolius]
MNPNDPNMFWLHHVSQQNAFTQPQPFNQNPFGSPGYAPNMPTMPNMPGGYSQDPDFIPKTQELPEEEEEDVEETQPVRKGQQQVNKQLKDEARSRQGDAHGSAMPSLLPKALVHCHLSVYALTVAKASPSG